MQGQRGRPPRASATGSTETGPQRKVPSTGNGRKDTYPDKNQLSKLDSLKLFLWLLFILLHVDFSSVNPFTSS